MEVFRMKDLETMKNRKVARNKSSLQRHLQNPLIKNVVRAHIESSYLLEQIAWTYIYGSLSLADIHIDQVKKRREQNKPYANYAMFHNIFVI